MADISKLSNEEVQSLYAAHKASNALSGLSDDALRDLRNSIVETPGMFRGATEAMTEGITLGLGDEVGAAGGALGAKVRGVFTGDDRSIGEHYDQQVARKRMASKRFASENPGTALTANIAGGLGLGGVANRAYAMLPVPAKLAGGMKETLLRSGAVGAEFGGVSGLGHGEGNIVERLPNAGKGVLFGGVTGVAAPAIISAAGAVARPVVRAVMDRVRPETAMMRKYSDAVREGGGTLESVIAQQKQMGPQGTLADFGGENVKKLARGVANAPGPAQAAASATMTGRATTQADRIGAALNKATGIKESTYAAQARLEAARKTAANKAYDESFAEVPELPADVASKLLASSQKYQSAMAEARTFQAYSDLPDNSMKLWHAVYESVGGMGRAANRAGNNSLARLHKIEADGLRKVLAEHNPKYLKAASEFADDIKLENALEAGTNLFKTESEATTDYLLKLSPEEKMQFITGVRGAVMKIWDRVAPTADGANRIINRPGVRRQLKAAFGSTKKGDAGDLAYREFRTTLRNESAFARTRFVTTGGADTARNQAAAQDATASDAVDVVSNLAQGRGGAAAQSAGRSILDFVRRQPAAVRNEATKLFSTNQKRNAEILQKMRLQEILRGQKFGAQDAAGAVAPNLSPSMLERNALMRALSAAAAQRAGM